jgi:DNA-binding NtrC family response regulator
MSFHLPPLRERVEDIAPLVGGMVARYGRKFKRDVRDVSAEAVACLEAFSWPGNIRELENVMQQAVLMSAGPDLRIEHLPEIVREEAMFPLHGKLERVERET